jgi:hypothetical protein
MISGFADVDRRNGPYVVPSYLRLLSSTGKSRQELECESSCADVLDTSRFVLN